MTAGPTPFQTVGPYFHLGLTWPEGAEVVTEDTPGAIWLHGRLLDGDGAPIDDGMVETWQADASGRYPSEEDPRGAATDFRGFGRSATDTEGRWAVRTVKPGPVPGPDGTIQAPHIAVGVFARGLLARAVTRLYFGDEQEANGADPVLSRLDPARAATLVAAPVRNGYELDIRMQGEQATVFFDLT